MKKKLIIIGIIVAIILIPTIIGFTIYQKTKNEVQEECTPFTGGGYTLYFETNGGNKLESMHVCIACSPDSYEILPTPTKENDTFEGWYLDKRLKEKVSAPSSKDIIPVPEKNKKGCTIGYKDITLYAKWANTKSKEESKEKSKESEKTTSKESSKYYCVDGSTPSNGKCTSTEIIAANVNYSCENGTSPTNNKCHTGNNLPATGHCPANSTYFVVSDSCVEITNDDEDACVARGGYIEFGTSNCMIDHGRPTNFVCEGDAAGWELINNSYCEEVVDATITYSCPGGYTQNGNQCSKTNITKALKK